MTLATTTQEREIWGILGGMGPLASAEFINSIYEETAGCKEQESPIVILWSDPTVPDRTECLLSGRYQPLLERLTSSIQTLASLGATRIVICCMTIHAIIHLLPSVLREKVISLLDVTLETVIRRQSQHLLFCTTGTRKMRLFEEHPLWPQAQNMIILPDDDDQGSIHKLLYEVKGQQEIAPRLELVEDLMKRYRAESYVAGCTEMHIVAKAHGQSRGCHWKDFCVDPLTEVLPLMRTHISHSGAYRQP